MKNGKQIFGLKVSFFLIVFLSFFLISLSFVNAYPVQIGVSSLDNNVMGSVVYHCTSVSCNSLNILEGAFASNYNFFNLPNRGAGTQYFAEFSYQTCTVPWTWRWDIDAGTPNGPWNVTTDAAHAANYIRNFTKRADCNSTVSNMAVSNSTPAINQSVSINATISSGFKYNSFVNTIPIEMTDIYSTNVTARLYIDGINIQNKSFSIPINQTRAVSFSYTPLIAGVHSVVIGTTFEQECKCSGWIERNATLPLFNVTNSTYNNTNITTNTTLNVTSITCFDYVIIGHNQSCTVNIKANGTNVGNANVTIYYSTGSLFGNCITSPLTGSCEAKRQENVLGNYSAYANADLLGYNQFNLTYPRFNYSVIAERYLIQNLSVYNDSSFTNLDYDFFRGESIYVQFSAYDKVTNQTVTGLQAEAYLISGPGGRIKLTNLSNSLANYRFFSVIPLTHEFLGTSQVFSFVFNFSNNTGGEAQVDLTIRNNIPLINPAIPNQSVARGSSTTLNLASYESDLEDSGNNLTWSVSGEDGSILTASIAGKILTLTGVAVGTDAITLTLTDLDGASASQNIDVRVTSGGGSDDDDDDSSSYRARESYNVTSLNSDNQQVVLAGSANKTDKGLFWLIILVLAIAIGVLVILILLLM